MVVHHWSDDGMVMYHRRSLKQTILEKPLQTSQKLMLSPHKEHVSLRDLLIKLVVLVGKAEDLKCVVFVVREVEFHRHIGHLQR